MPTGGLIAVLVILCGCGACGSSAEQAHDGSSVVVDGEPGLDGSSVVVDGQPGDGELVDAPKVFPPPSEDGLTPLGYAEPVWETVLPVTADTLQEYYIDGAVALPTGIAVIIPPDLFLIDKTDGHIIAQSSMPEVDGGGQAPQPLAMLARASGDLAILANFDRQRLVVFQYAKEDLAQQGTMVVLEENGPTGVMAEVNGELVVYTGTFGEEGRHLHIVSSAEPAGTVETKAIADIADQIEGIGFGTPDHHMTFCAITRNENDDLTYAEIVRIDPATAAFEKVRISDTPTQSGMFCWLLAGEDGLMAVWMPDTIEMGELPHWTRLSLDGTEVVADNPVPLYPLGDTVAHIDGELAVLSANGDDGYELRTVSPSTGAVAGPYDLRLQFGERASAYDQAIASDGQNLYVVIAPSPSAQHRIQKLGPLPRPANMGRER